ncbi:MAG: hypothetical protein EBT30_04110 [Verrucomicrobia bacterium]|nr:hypothetical protein [Verrucomicrobiota bacterium]
MVGSDQRLGRIYEGRHRKPDPLRQQYLPGRCGVVRRSVDDRQLDCAGPIHLPGRPDQHGVAGEDQHPGGRTGDGGNDQPCGRVIADFAGDSNFPAFQAGLLKRSNGLTTIGAANTFTGEVKVTGGTLKLGTNGSFASGSSLILQGGNSILDLSGKTQEFSKINAINGQVVLGAGTLAVGGTNLSEFGGVISGTGGFTQKGTGTTFLSGSNTYTGTTAVDAGKLVVNGALVSTGSVTVASNAVLGGSGRMGRISGSGMVDAGNSPGILTATSLNLSGGLDFNFELFGFNPNYTAPMNSVNDVVRLTGSTPFGSDFSSANALNFYLTLPNNFAFGTNQVFKGGFLADFANTLSAAGTKWLDNIKKATLNFFVADSNGGVNYGGNKYVSLADYAKNTSGQRDANFVLSEEAASGISIPGGTTTPSTAKVLGLQMISTIKLNAPPNLVYNGQPKTYTAVSVSNSPISYTTNDFNYLYVGTNNAGTVYSNSVPPTDAGTYTITASVKTNPDVDKTATFTITRSNPVILWSNLAAVTYPTALGGMQLSATESNSLAGAFSYAPPSGVIPNAGTNNLVATFTPADTNNFAIALRTNTLVVSKGTPVLTWGSLNPIPYGTALTTELGASEINGVVGSITYNQVAGAVLNGGTNKLIATFYPTDAVNYETVSRTNTLVVTKAAATVTLLSQSNLFTGFPIASTNTNTTPSGLGLKLRYNGSLVTPAGLGTYTVVAEIDDVNYEGSATNSLQIFWPPGVPLPTVALAAPASFEYDGQPKTYTASAVYTNTNGTVLTLLDFAYTYQGTDAKGSAYNSTNAPVVPGSYTVTASIRNSGVPGSASSNFTIPRKGLTVVSVAGETRVYDASATATISNVVFSGVVGSDDVAYDYASPATYADKSVGMNRPITTTTNLTGTTAAYYILSNAPSVTGTITPKTLTVAGLSVTTRDYDRTTTAPVTGVGSLVGKIGGDAVNLSGTVAGTYASASAGTSKAVTLSGLSLTGADAGNYELDLTGLTGDVDRKAVTIATLEADDKVFDGTADATVSNDSLTGVLAGDNVALSITGATIAFTDEHAGTNKPVAASGLTLAGSEAANYVLTGAVPSLRANISARPVTISSVTVATREYDTTTGATLAPTATLVGVLPNASVLLDDSGVTASFADKNVGAGKPVAVSGYVLQNNTTLASNYALTQPTGVTGTITAKALTITGATVADRIYDGSSDAPLSGGTLVGVFGSEDVQLRSLAASYADAHVGAAKPVANTGFSLTGADIGNYTLTQPTLTGRVDPKNLFVTGVTAVTRAYDRTTNVALTGTAVLSGLVTGESLTLDTNNAVASLADWNADTNKAVTVTGFAVSGVTAGNYNLVQAPNLTVDITPRSVSLAGLTSLTKEYDGTTAISLSGISGLNGVISPDDVQLGGSAAGQFADPLVGANKPVAVTGATLAGADAANYALDSNLPVTGEITKRRLVLAGATAQDKFYDGTTTAALSGGTLTGIVSGEDVRLSANPTAEFNTNTVGTNIPVTVKLDAGIRARTVGGGGGVTLMGTHAGNYLVVQPTGLAGNIHPAPITVANLAVVTREYAGSSVVTATLDASGATLNGVVPGDSVGIDTSASIVTFNDGNAGINKPMTIVSLVLNGPDAAKYTLTAPSGLLGEITPKLLDVTGVSASNKFYDATTVATLWLGRIA